MSTLHTPATGLPALPPSAGLPQRAHPDGAVPPHLRNWQVRTAPIPDAVVFDAPCPCGEMARWDERRVDTRIKIEVWCRACEQRDRARLRRTA